MKHEFVPRWKGTRTNGSSTRGDMICNRCGLHIIPPIGFDPDMYLSKIIKERQTKAPIFEDCDEQLVAKIHES